jgi:hypothetical protein
MNYEDIRFDPSEDKVLGVFENNVHVRVTLHDFDEDEMEVEEDVVLLIPQNVYLRTWKNWLEGKKDYCERYGEYCGVMGETRAIKPKLQNFTVNLYDYFFPDENSDTPETLITRAKVFMCKKFELIHEFEHG